MDKSEREGGGRGGWRAGSSEGFLIYLFGALLLFYSISHHHVNNFPPESLNYSLKAALFACGGTETGLVLPNASKSQPFVRAL